MIRMVHCYTTCRDVTLPAPNAIPTRALHRPARSCSPSAASHDRAAAPRPPPPSRSPPCWAAASACCSSTPTRQAYAVEWGEAAALPWCGGDGNLAAGVAAVKHDYDVVIIDTPANAPGVTTAAMMAADGVLVPTQPTMLDAWRRGHHARAGRRRPRSRRRFLAPFLLARGPAAGPHDAPRWRAALTDEWGGERARSRGPPPRMSGVRREQPRAGAEPLRSGCGRARSAPPGRGGRVMTSTPRRTLAEAVRRARAGGAHRRSPPTQPPVRGSWGRVRAEHT